MQANANYEKNKMKKKIYIGLAVIAVCLIAVFFYGRRYQGLKIVDEFGVEHSKFPYVNWRASVKVVTVTVDEILDYRTFRAKDGSIITLCAVSKALRAGASREFMARELLEKKAVIFVCRTSGDYLGIFHAVVFYDNAAKCLNKDLYDEGFVDINIENRYFFAKKWFDAEAD